MPPKSAKSKAEKERQKREEEERKRIEEEEDRLRAIQEEKERKKRERLEAEENKKREKEELIKRTAELEELRTIFQNLFHKLKIQEEENKVKAKWDRYMLCDGSPDPNVPQEINTYINLWKDDDERVIIDQVLDDCELCLRLIDELERVIEDQTQGDDNLKEKERCQRTIAELQDLLCLKLDRASHEMLCRASSLVDSETANMQKVWKNNHVRLCLWANLGKNPRIKSFEFVEEGITFDIPKVLTMADCGYRILFTKFDHFSPKSACFRAIRKSEPEPEVVEEVKPETEEKPEGENEEEEEAQEEVVEQSGADLLAELDKLDGGDEAEETEAPEPEVEVEIPPEDLEEPPAIPEWEDFLGSDDAIDMRAYQVLGGVFHFNLLALPPQPKVLNGWTMITKVTPPELKPLDYEVDVHQEVKSAEGEGTDSVPPPASVTPQANPSAPGGEHKDKKDEKPPISVTLKMSPDVNFAAKPVLARWDDKTLEWRTTGVEIENFKEDEREIVFKTTIFFTTLSLLQDFHINMPFQSWELRPYTGGPPPPEVTISQRGTPEPRGGSATHTPNPDAQSSVAHVRPTTHNHCLLTIIAAIHEVRLQVCEDQVAVVPDPEKPELNMLADRWMSVEQMVKALRDAGVNVFPREDSSKYVTVATKDQIAEDRLCDQMALLSPSMAFSWSRWSSEVKEEDKIFVQGCQHLENKPVDEQSWGLYAVTRKKVMKLKMTEFASEYSDELDEAHTFHADFFNMYNEFASEEGLSRVRSIDYKYFDTVRQLLKATRMLVFS